jgi:hypothetical protein
LHQTPEWHVPGYGARLGKGEINRRLEELAGLHDEDLEKES